VRKNRKESKQNKRKAEGRKRRVKDKFFLKVNPSYK
jgi:hypothetical protein